MPLRFWNAAVVGALRSVRAGQNSRDTQTRPMALQLPPSAQARRGVKTLLEVHDTTLAGSAATATAGRGYSNCKYGNFLRCKPCDPGQRAALCPGSR